MSRKLLRSISAVLLVAIVVAFAWRTFLHWGQRMWDYGLAYNESQQWIDGRSPYDVDELAARWARQPHPSGVADTLPFETTNLLPSTLVMIAPLALLPPPPSFALWLVIHSILIAGMIVALVWLADVPWLGWRSLLIGAGVLMGGPLRGGIQSGQYAVPAIALLIIASCLLARQRATWLAGVLLALGCAFKPQLGLPFVAYWAWRRQWRAAIIGGALFALITIVGIARLELAGTHWYSPWKDSVARTAAPGGALDFTSAHYQFDQLLNLQMPVHAVFPSRPVAHAVALGVAGAMALLLLVLSRPGRSRPGRSRFDELAGLGCLSVIVLLPVYHRYYDGAIVALALALVLRDIRWGRPVARWVAVAVLATLLLPVTPASNLAERGQIPPSLQSTWAWRALARPAHAWLMPILAAALLWTEWNKGREKVKQMVAEPGKARRQQTVAAAVTVS